MNKIESFEDLIFDLTASRNSEWYKAGVRIDACDEDELKSIVDRDVKPQSRIIFTPDEDDNADRWEGPYFYIFRESAPDFSNAEQWEIDYREIAFECHCATMAGPKVLKKLAKAFEKLFGQKTEKNEEPLFNVYFEADNEESGEPEYRDQTMEQCKEICEKMYDAYLKGNLNPWNWGTIDPKTENFAVICSCSNGYTEDEFGMCTWGPQAGKFTDYPKEVANKSYRESFERITKSPLNERVHHTNINCRYSDEDKKVPISFAQFDGLLNQDSWESEEWLDWLQRKGISLARKDKRTYLEWEKLFKEYIDECASTDEEDDYYEGCIRTGDDKEEYCVEKEDGVWVTYPGGQKWPASWSRDQVVQAFLNTHF